MSGFGATDHAMMARALRLAERGAFTTRPNPMVGCVIAHGDEVVGEGWHQRKGGPHAEVFALREAGERARGATAYVTLEPCAHTGATGPCADALVAAGVARVVAAMADPFPQVNGAGFERLRAAGIAVDSGLMQAQARALNAGFLSLVERGRPYVRVKLAASLDGRTSAPDGSSQWITGAAERADGHRWRARAGAILTGSGTVLADDPQLTVRLDDVADDGVVAPLRVVLDSRLRTLARTRVRDGDAPTLYLHGEGVQPPPGLQIAHQTVASGAHGLDLHAVLGVLAARAINTVHVEAGAALAGALLAAGLVDEIVLYLAPTLLGEDGGALLRHLGITTMAGRIDLQLAEVVQVGGSLRLLLRPR